MLTTETLKIDVIQYYLGALAMPCSVAVLCHHPDASDSLLKSEIKNSESLISYTHYKTTTHA